MEFYYLLGKSLSLTLNVNIGAVTESRRRPIREGTGSELIRTDTKKTKHWLGLTGSKAEIRGLFAKALLSLISLLWLRLSAEQISPEPSNGDNGSDNYHNPEEPLSAWQAGASG